MARLRFPSLLALLLLVGACSTPAESPASTSPPLASDEPSPSPSPVASASASEAPPTASPSSAPASPITWRAIEQAAPTPTAREDGTWTVDSRTPTAYLFGGRDGSTLFNDLWAFDLEQQSWTELTPTGDPPAKRFGHEAVWVEGLGVVVFAGQAGPTTFFDDLWVYEPEANMWRELPVEGTRPKARYGTCAAVGPDGRLWISHGFTEDGTRFADTQAYDFATNRWTDETPEGQAPVTRCLHGCWWTDDGRFALYAGQTTGVTALGDLRTLADPATPDAEWSQVDGELPPDRNLYAFARHGDAVVVTGGRGLDGYLNDAFTFDAATLEVESLSPEGEPPPGRSGAMMIDDADRGRALLFGGKTADGAMADLWELGPF